MMILNEQLAQLMAPYPEYTPRIQETHHIHKLDAPSGTAITLAEGLIEQTPSLHDWHLGVETHDGSLGIEAIREGEVPGIHTVIYHYDIDAVSYTHLTACPSGSKRVTCRVARSRPKRSPMLMP